MKYLFSLVVIFLTLTAQASTLGIADSVGTKTEAGKTYIQYLVSPGETIYRISTSYGVSISELLEINPTLENGLKVGQVLLIPFRPTLQHKEQGATEIHVQNSESSEVVHTVQPGETLYSLSRKYKVSVGDLLKWNGMELQAGQKIIVNKEGPKTPDQPQEEAKVVEEKPVVTTPKPQVVVTPKPVVNPVKEETVVALKNQSVTMEQEVTKQHYRYRFDSTLKQVLIIPFDPHLYFSDADDEIARGSNINRVKVREVFRRRLDALLDPPGYEVIHLMGGRSVDSLLDLNKIYSSVTYNYQEILESEYHTATSDHAEMDIEDPKQKSESLKSWMNKQKQKLVEEEEVHSKGNHEKFDGKYFGVKVKNPDFFTYFKQKYSVDYYIFINEFEVMTNYENCLDRSVQNYEREFVVHYSIFDEDGVQFSGNKYKVHYPSNSNDIMKIVADNVGQISQRILDDLPKPDQTRRK